MNSSGLKPVEYNVLVLPQKIEEKTKGGLLLPDETKDKEQFGQIEGTIVDASPMAFTFEDWPEDAEDMKPKVGDKVVFKRYEATEFKGKDGEIYWLMKDRAIAGVLS